MKPSRPGKRWLGLSHSTSFYSRVVKLPMCYLQATERLQLDIKSELASLTGDGGEQKKLALGVEHVSAREKRNPSGRPQEIIINIFAAFTDSQVVTDLKTLF